MFGRKKLLILVPAIILISILLAMTPLNLIHKLSVGCPFSKDKTVEKCNYCPFHSIVSQNDLAFSSLDATPYVENSPSSFYFQISGLDSLRSNISSKSLPLRC